MAEKNNSDIPSRVASLETAVTSLSNSLESHAKSMQTQMEAIFRKLETQARPQYTVMLGVLGVVMSVVALYVSPLKGELDHEKAWQAATDMRLTTEIDKLDRRLQKEYELINAEVKTRFEHVSAETTDRYNQNRHDIDRLDKWQQKFIENKMFGKVSNE